MNEEMVHNIPLPEIFSDDEFNCRGPIDTTDQDMLDLMRSIKTNGLLQPIIVSPYDKDGYKYVIRAGHRRFAAFIRLREKTIPAIVKQNLSEKEARIINLSENLVRKNLNILQEAKALIPLGNLGMDVADIVKALPGVSTGWVEVRLMLLTMPTEIQEEASVGILTQSHIKDLYNLKQKGYDNDTLFSMVRKVKEAKEKGDKAVNTIKANSPIKVDPSRVKKRRDADECFKMIEYMMKRIGCNIGTRSLAWAAGEISDADIYAEIKMEATRLGIQYEVPYFAGVHLLE